MVENYRTLLEIVEAIASHRDLAALFHELGATLQRIVPYDFLTLILHDDERQTIRIHLLETNQSREAEGREYAVDDAPSGLVVKTQRPLVVHDLTKETRWPKLRREIFEPTSVRALCTLPLTTARGTVGALSFLSRTVGAYDAVDQEFLMQVCRQIALAVENVQAYGCIAALNEKLDRERVYLQQEVRTNFEDIVGASTALARVMKDVAVVAPTDSTVLVRGETGTGKELIARAVHSLSPRRERTLVKLNCAAIPTGLLESELFGHEKGAFTGAVAQKIGRFEVAHEGTLFLDEVGDIPLELQPKLLRVLQEQEFERLGGTRTIKVRVRLVAATNRDLAKMVSEGRFRDDLFYRLNVFPVTLPPLRERVGDVVPLVKHFVQKFAVRMGRRIESIPEETLAVLSRYSWPGNVRELENFIERSVILSSGSVLQAPLSEIKSLPGVPSTSTSISTSTPTPTPGIVPLVDAERELIVRALKETNWRVGGPTGAAARLGMNRTTLQSRMKKLGIERAS